MTKIRPSLNIVGENLRRLRKAKQMRQDDIVAQLNIREIHISRSTYSKFEIGYMNIKDSEIIALAEIFETEINDFFVMQKDKV